MYINPTSVSAVATPNQPTEMKADPSSSFPGFAVPTSAFTLAEPSVSQSISPIPAQSGDATNTSSKVSVSHSCPKTSILPLVHPKPTSVISTVSRYPKPDCISKVIHSSTLNRQINFSCPFICSSHMLSCSQPYLSSCDPGQQYQSNRRRSKLTHTRDGKSWYPPPKEFLRNSMGKMFIAKIIS